MTVAKTERFIPCCHADMSSRGWDELDVLYEEGNVPPQKRLASLEADPAGVAGRSDALAQEISTDDVVNRMLAAVPAHWVSPKPNDAFSRS